jgi:hypothetical protein
MANHKLQVPSPLHNWLFYWGGGGLNCCWPSPAQLFLVLSPTGLRPYFAVSQVALTTDLPHWSSLYSPSMDCLENTASHSSFVVLCIFIATEACLSCDCLAVTISSGSAMPPFRCHVIVYKKGKVIPVQAVEALRVAGG